MPSAAALAAIERNRTSGLATKASWTSEEAQAAGLGWVPDDHPAFGTPGFVGPREDEERAQMSLPETPTAPTGAGGSGAPMPASTFARPTRGPGAGWDTGGGGGLNVNGLGRSQLSAQAMQGLRGARGRAY